MLRKIAIAVGLLILAVLGFAATRSDTFRVERTARIDAPPDRIFPLIENFRSWGAWSPYEKLDPAMKRTYSGAPEGKGAIYEWQGDKNVGKGRMEIVEVAVPSTVVIALDFLAPFEAHNLAEFTMEGEGAATNVTWAMTGPRPYVAKLMSVFFDMDHMIGKDFEAGLANLKTAAEK